jgi:hypothetical protein
MGERLTGKGYRRVLKPLPLFRQLHRAESAYSGPVSKPQP